MKHNKHNERIANLKDEIKALKDNLEWVQHMNTTLSQGYNKLQSKNYCLARLARHNGLVLVLMGIMLDGMRNEYDDTTITNMKNAILKYYEETAKIITLLETQIDDDEETYE